MIESPSKALPAARIAVAWSTPTLGAEVVSVYEGGSGLPCVH
jgi:hypothetical protein